jgi:1-acyl-sn-glycerol-3-phosphate acyltransferase
MLYAGVELIARVLFNAQLGTIKGLEKLPAPPCILAVNHVSPYDPIILVLQLYPWLTAYNKKIMFLTNRKVLTVLSPFYKFFGMFPNTREGLRKAVGYLRQGFPVGIFPNRDREKRFFRMFHLGPAYLSKMTNVDIIPIGIKTAEEVWPSWDIKKAIKNLLYKKHIVIGDPIKANNFKNLKTITSVLTERIARLVGKEVQ